MKNLILENDHKMDIPKELVRVLETHFIENQEYWTHFSNSYWPENREKTIERFKSLEKGDNIICATVFDGWQQLEIMALILAQCPVKLNFYIMINSLKEQIIKYLSEKESDITPNNDKYNDSYQLRLEFKNDMNLLIKLTLKNHNFYQLSKWHPNKEPIHIILD